MVGREELQCEQRRAAAGGALVVEAPPKQLEHLAEPKLPDRPVRDGALAVIPAAGRRFELLAPLRAQVRELALQALFREAVRSGCGLGECQETDCSERVAGPT